MELGYRPGLEGVIAAQTRLSSVDGEAGELVIAGYPVQEIALNATFEEVVYLLWRDALSAGGELTQPFAGSDAHATSGLIRSEDFKREMAERRTISPVTMQVLREAATAGATPMDALRAAAGTLGIDCERSKARGESDSLPLTGAGPGRGSQAEAMTAVAGFPTIVAAYHRLVQGLEPIAPRHDLRHAANFLYMMTGDVPGETQTRGLEAYLATVVDHGLNASTFTARVIVSTGSDIISAVVGAVGALKGPLHGGAPGPALDMVFEVGTADRAEPYLRAKLERGERLMGFGHRIYKVRDPRADVLACVAERLYEERGTSPQPYPWKGEGDKSGVPCFGSEKHAVSSGDPGFYQLAKHVEQTALRLLDEYKPGRRLQTNVEFYTALVLHGLGIPTSSFTPVFAAARVAGWTAHCLEQQRANRIIRPQSEYVGAVGRRWPTVDETA